MRTVEEPPGNFVEDGGAVDFPEPPVVDGPLPVLDGCPCVVDVPVASGKIRARKLVHIGRRNLDLYSLFTCFASARGSFSRCTRLST